MSPDPFTRIALSYLEVGETIPGAQVGRVIQSKCEEFPTGCQVIGKFGWRDFTIVKPGLNVPRVWPNIAKLEDLHGLPPSFALGALGMPGNTAYFGLVEVMKPVAGETLLVSSASGAIGSLVGQIGKIKGCRVIGLAGNDQKVNWLRNEIGFDVALNYKQILSIQDTLNDVAPEGIDCYFDNVGGEMLYNVMECMNNLGRIGQCGSMASYNESAADGKLYANSMTFRYKNLSLLGFNTSRWTDKWTDGINQIQQWILKGDLKVEETITTGFENTPQAFIDMLEGKNIGKQIVKV